MKGKANRGRPARGPGQVTIPVSGGGVLDRAVAFYLAKQNAGHVIVPERNAAAQGNSSLAAGLLTRGRFKSYLIPMVLETYQAVEEIEAILSKSRDCRTPRYIGLQRGKCSTPRSGNN